MSPEQIGRYPVTSLLGQGGMGMVYAALDPRLHRSIAIKVLPDPVALDARQRERLEQEACLLAAINHPNIATIFSLEDDGDRHFLTMELVPGATLGERMQAIRPSVDEALNLGHQIARGLEAAHRSGVIHLDLKPGNIRVTPEGTVKILDFGLARVWSGGRHQPELTSEDTTAPDGFLGTPGFMSPEQLRQQGIDHRSDIWAMGCVLFELFAGRPAFPGKSLADRIAVTLEREPDWSALAPDTPDRVRGLLRRTLEKARDERIGETSLIRRELEEEIVRRKHPTPPETQVAGLSESPHNLPALVDQFIGREAELREVEDVLQRTRLLTLTGMGGSGKTRLALESAWRLRDRFPEGVWLVGLVSVRDEEQMVAAAAQVFDLKEEPRRSLLATLQTHLSTRSALLLLDNCEHIVDACASVVDALLSACPRLRILATSRERLGVRGETLLHVPTMETPAGVSERDGARQVERVRAAESVQLFLDRAQAIRPDFDVDDGNAPAVAAICRQLDGIPLALELAAARTRVLSVEEIAQRLDDRFHLLASQRDSTLPHHQTLRSLIDWSFDLLSETERALLRRLSVFAGGWTLESAERVAAFHGIEDWEILDLHSGLVEKSLIERDVQGSHQIGRARYRILETVRQYAWDRLLEVGEDRTAVRRHRERFLALAESASAHLVGPEQGLWSRILEAEHDNFRAAIDRSDDAPQTALRIAGSLGRYWYGRGRWTEGRELMRRLLAHPEAARRNEPRAHALAWMGWIALWQGDFDEAWRANEESLSIRREVNDSMGVSQSLNNLAAVAVEQGDYETARTLNEESLELRRQLGNARYVAVSLHNLGELSARTGDDETARTYFEESLRTRREVGDLMGIADSLSALGGVATRLGDLAEARRHLDESLANRRSRDDRMGIAECLHRLAEVDRHDSESAAAEASLREALTIRAELDDHLGITESLESLGLLAEQQGERVRAVHLLSAVETHRVALGARRSPDRESPIESAKSRLREAMGADRFREEWDTACRWNLPNTLHYALGPPTP